MSPSSSSETGIFVLDGRISIAANLMAQEIIQQGLRFDREIDMQNGWVMCASASHLIFGQAVTATFNFYNDRLKMFGFALMGDAEDTADDQKNAHDRFLVEHFGEPLRRSELANIHEFWWGCITSQRDPRGGTCSIEVNWRP
ncbi:hypothetical protein [Pseudomonas sp.]|uniref:hypothetical protein n=1 Tax=Pseudomonas sp. TaxID=306 RepID=UPI003C3FBFD6